MTPKQFHQLVVAFPETEPGTSYGMPSYKAFGKFFTRLRPEDASCVIGQVDFDEREMLCAAEPETFHVTDHYRNHPYVLARIASIEPQRLRMYLDRQWRRNAPKTWLKAWDGGRAAATARPAHKPGAARSAPTGARVSRKGSSR
jgi:hypothetical protein